MLKDLRIGMVMIMSKVLPDNICPDYKCDINCRFNLCNASKESCLTCEFNFGCIDCKKRDCFHLSFYPGNYYHDYVKNPVETIESQQD